MNTRLEVSLGLWQDRPAEEALKTAALADELGFPALWIGEMATYDACALGMAVAARTERISLTLRPFAVAVRDPMMIAMGVASVASLSGRTVDVALGTSSQVVVEEWHGRSRARSARALSESAQALRPLLDGEKSSLDGEVVRSRGYHLRLPAPKSSLTVAAFGPSAIRTAARYADRMVLNLVSVETARALIADLRREAAALDRPCPRIAVWLSAAVDMGKPAIDQIRRAVVGYLAAPGYSEMFERAGFGDVVAYARTRPHPRDLLARVPDELVAAVGVIGDRDQARARVEAYIDAGVDDIVFLPSATDADPAGERTLRSLAGIFPNNLT
ncbi:LLM class F420-dependent oxidoreductase [Rhodococcus sp. ARC_M6]|uniref:LLM class F420-dependent oxidoreductase n=1 Tax=Rhodococcus sp. ARC_M6 TaxID=2928852 RepID=UPI001FB245D9|nr:LLM class F420-dependent oxidoreductase [Rhodococcus sp. ARC_M6]MCJ0903189.1 LLM class F420-dependent oxidoreductase [Rhodococcus sp. ARC_M6]